MPRYMLVHCHSPEECGAAFAAWRGFDSPLRHDPAVGSCVEGGHSLWWTVEAKDETEAIGLLPDYVAERTEVSRVSEVPIP